MKHTLTTGTLSLVAAIVLACGLGIVFYLVVVALERVVLPWHAAQRESAA